jgi:hypothetical protein
MAQTRGADTNTPWWRTVPAMLTAAATFIGSVAALLALFIGPGGGGGGSNGDPARGTPSPMPTPAEERSVPLKSQPATEANVRKLLTMVPASVRSRCEQDPDEFRDELARLSLRPRRRHLLLRALCPRARRSRLVLGQCVCHGGRRERPCPQLRRGPDQAAVRRNVDTARATPVGRAAAVRLQLRSHDHRLDRDGTADLRLDGLQRQQPREHVGGSPAGLGPSDALMGDSPLDAPATKTALGLWRRTE